MINTYNAQNIELTAAQLLRAVNGLIQYRSEVTRPTLARWRKEWNTPHAPYSWDDARVLAKYGDLLALGFSPEKAMKYTIEHFENQGNKTNDQHDSERQSSTATTIDTTAEPA